MEMGVRGGVDGDGGRRGEGDGVWVVDRMEPVVSNFFSLFFPFLDCRKSCATAHVVGI